ncbi:MAG: glycine cleavage system protein R [Acidobacteriota bacterium]|nr:MAG: glycine cleavage system protein R [Acidobacteriota bacterium]
MTASLVLTVIGDDRPGLVESVSEVVEGHGGNWLESRMARLSGKFAGIVQIEVSAAESARLERALGELCSRGLHVVVESAGDPGPGLDQRGWHRLTLDVVGQDRPGIVKSISHVLAERGVNVEELDTDRRSAPMSGQMLFHAKARLRLPPEVSLDELHGALERVAADLMVDLRLLDATTPTPS